MTNIYCGKFCYVEFLLLKTSPWGISPMGNPSLPHKTPPEDFNLSQSFPQTMSSKHLLM